MDSVEVSIMIDLIFPVIGMQVAKGLSDEFFPRQAHQPAGCIATFSLCEHQTKLDIAPGILGHPCICAP